MEEIKLEGTSITIHRIDGKITVKMSVTVYEHQFDAKAIGVSFSNALNELENKLNP